MTITLNELSEIDLPIYPNSLVEDGEITYFLGWTPQGKRLGVLGPAGSTVLESFSGVPSAQSDRTLLVCLPTHANAGALRMALPWLRPQTLGLRTSAGCGDRMGLATPGHVRAARSVGARATGARATGGDIGMVFAQQSIREMTRTARSPDDVMDDATWGIFQEGWREVVGADADHLKTTADIDVCVAAGYTFFTIDPGAHVDPAADTDDEADIRAKYAALPWPDLATTAHDLQAAYIGKRIGVEDRDLALDEETLLRAAVKYGRAVAHVAALYRHLASIRPADAIELEVSVDETDTPTSHAEHLFIARELRRLGVRWVSLAPRYVGSFEKGVDYIGDLAAFEADFAGHAAIARALGPYKLSLHSGSDKFSIYGIAAELTRGLVHLKTAGTSYLEALRATAVFDPALFREILAFAIERFETDRASYHVSARLAAVPRPETLADGDLPGLLEQFDARQVLHITFGSVLTTPALKDRLVAGLLQNEETYYDALERHFIRHLKPLAGKA
jgi:tagaturonate epimerase